MNNTFENLRASLLYCPKCARAMPVRERLLLVLPNGDQYDYLCEGCGSSLGSKTVSGGRPPLSSAVPFEKRKWVG
jgi:hypothetical protein